MRLCIQHFLRSKEAGKSPKAIQTRGEDLHLFLEFFKSAVGRDVLSRWTPKVTLEFQQHLLLQTSGHTGRRYTMSSVYRILRAVRRMARWLMVRWPLPKDPAGTLKLSGLRPRSRAWKSLRRDQLSLMRKACTRRWKSCWRRDQNGALEGLVYHLLLETGLGESELVSLNRRHVVNEGLVGVPRAGEWWTFPLSSEALRWMDRYLEWRGRWDGPLLLARTGERLAPQDVRRICHRLSKEASEGLPVTKQFTVNPRDLRYTFLTRVLKKHGALVAHRVSGFESRQAVESLSTKESRMTPTEEEIFRSRLPW